MAQSKKSIPLLHDSPQPDEEKLPQPNGFAFLPLFIFLGLFLGIGVWLTKQGVNNAFYQVSPAVLILPAIAIAIICYSRSKQDMQDRVGVFLAGVGDINIITMCIIFLLAGGFASAAGAIGGVQAAVDLGLHFVPPKLVLPGIFFLSALIATSMGTSMGTIAAVAPIAAGIALQADMNLTLVMGAVLGGAMFGDNLSMISDTTIAATKTQDCNMADKFMMNLIIVLPAAVLTLVCCFIFGTQATVTAKEIDFSTYIPKVVPYITILVLALARVNVFVVLAVGIVLAGAVGLYIDPEYSLIGFCQDIFAGFTEMREIFFLSMLIGGLGALLRYNGGIAWLLAFIGKITNDFQGKNASTKGELAIAGLVTAADVCTANNTVAIVLSGEMAKKIADKSGISCKRSASILDIFSCITQGLIPHAAQVLLVGTIGSTALAKAALSNPAMVETTISPFAVVSSNYYCMLLLVTALLAIFFKIPPETSK